MSTKHPRAITELSELYGMRMLVRASLDVPIKDGVVTNDFRIRRAIPTFKYLLDKGARVIILTHVGRDPQNSTLPLLVELEKYIPIHYVKGVTEEEVYGKVAHMKEGTALLLENLRSYKEEEENNDEFAQKIASYGNFYVNDAFTVSHRAHASVVGIPKHLPSFAGMTFMEEYTELSKAFVPEAPSLFILGGAKFETKAPLIEKYVDQYTHTFIGGALANDFLKGKGFEVGTSLLSDTAVNMDALLQKESLILPSHVVVVKGETLREAPNTDILPDEKILDVGLQSIEAVGEHIKNAKTILWNGPLGYYEGGYDAATKACAELVAKSNAFSIVGGGDTVAAIESLGLSDSFGFVSTSGGAMLEFLEKRTLPGIDALRK